MTLPNGNECVYVVKRAGMHTTVNNGIELDELIRQGSARGILVTEFEIEVTIKVNVQTKGRN